MAPTLIMSLAWPYLTSPVMFFLCVCVCFFKSVKVPLGTVVKELGKTILDMTEHGQEYLAAFGGAGGKGNRFFLSNENRSPMTATPGITGQERLLQLELRTMAHAGLVSRPCFWRENWRQTFHQCRCIEVFLFSFIPSGWLSKRWEIISVESHHQC